MKSKTTVFFVLLILLGQIACHTHSSNPPALEQPAEADSLRRASNSQFVYGIDISSYQGDEMDFLEKKKNDLTFIICKATEGAWTVDPDFDTNWALIQQKGFVRGAYHFYHCKDSPASQITNFSGVVKKFDRSGLPPIVDFEEYSIDSVRSVADIQKNLLLFLTGLEKVTGRKPIIYTDDNTGNLYLNDARFAGYALYVASYNGGKIPDLPDAWKQKRWLIWQKSDTVKIDGTQDDYDVFVGGPDSLNLVLKNY